MEDTEFILEHEILKVLYIRTSFYRAGYPRGDGKTVIMAKRDYKDATLYFGTLVDILNCPEKYNDDAMKSMQGMDRLMEEINTEKYNYGQVSNAIEVLESNEQVIDKVIENTSQQSGSRRITLTSKGAIDYRDNFYAKKKQNEGLDIKIKKITVNGTLFTRIVAISALAVALFGGAFPVYKYFKEQNQEIKSQEVQKQLPILIQEQQQLKQDIENVKKDLLRLKDTSIIKVKIVK